MCFAYYGSAEEVTFSIPDLQRFGISVFADWLARGFLYKLERGVHVGSGSRPCCRLQLTGRALFLEFFESFFFSPCPVLQFRSWCGDPSCGEFPWGRRVAATHRLTCAARTPLDVPPPKLLRLFVGVDGAFIPIPGHLFALEGSTNAFGQFELGRRRVSNVDMRPLALLSEPSECPGVET